MENCIGDFPLLQFTFSTTKQSPKHRQESVCHSCLSVVLQRHSTRADIENEYYRKSLLKATKAVDGSRHHVFESTEKCFILVYYVSGNS